MCPILPMLMTLWFTVVVEMHQRQNVWTSTQLVTMEIDGAWSRMYAVMNASDEYIFVLFFFKSAWGLKAYVYSKTKLRLHVTTH